MTAYLLVLILAVGIPFLLYCLGKFSRELRPRTSSVVLPFHASNQVPLSAIPLPRFRSHPHALPLQHQSRTAS